MTTRTESQSKVGTTGTSEGAGPDPDIQRARSPTVQGTHAQQNEKFTPLQRDNPMTRPNPDTQGTAPTTVQGVQPQLMPGPHSDIQRAAPPTAPGAPAQQNERITQPQRENPMPGPDSGTQRSTPPQREDPVPRPDPDNQRPAPPTVQGAPAQQNERVAHPQRENQVPRPGPSSKRTAPPLAQGAPPQQVTRSGRVSMRPPTLGYLSGFVPQESRNPTGAFRLPRAVAPKQPKTAGPTDV